MSDHEQSSEPEQSGGDWRSSGPSPEPQEQPAPEPAPEPSEEEQPQTLSPYQTTDFLTGRQPDEQEIERRQGEAMWDALESGEMVQNLAESQSHYNGLINSLKKDNPGIDTPESIRAMAPVLEQLAAEVGPELTFNPEILEQAFNAVGGTKKFTPDPQEEQWMRACGDANRNAFTR